MSCRVPLDFWRWLAAFQGSPRQFVYPIRDVSRKEGSDFTSCACAICKPVRVRADGKIILEFF
jgi:hypothetical protein